MVPEAGREKGAQWKHCGARVSLHLGLLAGRPPVVPMIAPPNGQLAETLGAMNACGQSVPPSSWETPSSVLQKHTYLNKSPENPFSGGSDRCRWTTPLAEILSMLIKPPTEMDSSSLLLYFPVIDTL